MTPLTPAAADPPHGHPPAPALPGLTIVLACFNEAAHVAQAIHAAHPAALQNAREHQIVVVDVGSTDGTGQIAAAVAHEVPQAAWNWLVRRTLGAQVRDDCAFKLVRPARIRAGGALALVASA